MKRIKDLFEHKSKGILSVYFCAGHPTLDGTADTLKALQNGKVDMVVALINALYLAQQDILFNETDFVVQVC